MTAVPSASASWSFANFSAASSLDCGLSSAVSSVDCGLSSAVSSVDCGLYSSVSSLCLMILLASASVSQPTLGPSLGDCTVLLHRTRLLLELRLLESFSGAIIDGVVCVMSSCGMSFLAALAQICVRP